MKRKASAELLRTDKKVEIASSVTATDPNGDLQIDFKKDGAPNKPLVSLLVNKHTLSLASPVFRTMLADNSPFRRSTQKNKAGNEVICWKDDDPTCMQIILNAIHLQGHRVPQHVSFEQLDQIAVLCDKYDLGRSLGSWGHLWARPYLGEIEDGGYARLLFIATVFKLADIFTEASKHVIMNATMEEGELVIEDDPKDFKEGVPDYILDSIITTRAEAVAQILTVCQERIRKLRHEEDPDVGSCQAFGDLQSEQNDCDALNLGSIMRVFPDLHTGSDVFASDVHSVHELMDDVRLIRHINDMNMLTKEFKRRHRDKCDAGHILRKRVQKIANRVEGLQLEEITSQPAPEVPEWLHNQLKRLRKERYPHDVFDPLMRYLAVSDATEVSVDGRLEEPEVQPADTRFRFIPMIKCSDCPGRLYLAKDVEITSRNIDQHTETPLHQNRRDKRLAEQG